VRLPFWQKPASLALRGENSRDLLDSLALRGKNAADLASYGFEIIDCHRSFPRHESTPRSRRRGPDFDTLNFTD
jgi:hypothetical protein